MDEYFEAKMRLFDELLGPEGTAVVWTDDPKSGEVIERVRRRGSALMTVGREGETIRLLDQVPTPLGQTVSLSHGGKTHRLALPLIGAYQAANVLVAAGLAMATGTPFEAAFPAMQRVSPVRGRLERAVISPKGAPVYIDYAHTGDALEAAIAALRPHVANGEGGRLSIVFRAGGDRDQAQRPEMGAVAARLSDVVIVTDDNPRGEDPAKIRREVLAGAPGATEIAGRREAIAAAIAMARAGDIVLVAGKGHEQGQIIGAGADQRVLPFDDAVVARECAA
jgi:UDP-N-acetylmuramoyl-L-alanyl-D-glutamate--2,6-diaminopimelate ligase